MFACRWCFEVCFLYICTVSYTSAAPDGPAALPPLEQLVLLLLIIGTSSPSSLCHPLLAKMQEWDSGSWGATTTAAGAAISAANDSATHPKLPPINTSIAERSGSRGSGVQAAGVQALAAAEVVARKLEGFGAAASGVGGKVSASLGTVRNKTVGVACLGLQRAHGMVRKGLRGGWQPAVPAHHYHIDHEPHGAHISHACLVAMCAHPPESRPLAFLCQCFPASGHPKARGAYHLFWGQDTRTPSHSHATE